MGTGNSASWSASLDCCCPFRLRPALTPAIAGNSDRTLGLCMIVATNQARHGTRLLRSHVVTTPTGFFAKYGHKNLRCLKSRDSPPPANLASKKHATRRQQGALGLVAAWREVNQHKLETPIEEIYAGLRTDLGRPVELDAGYDLASMATSPPRSTSMFKLCLSSNSIPTSGVLPVASALICLGWPSQRTVTS